MVLLLAACTSTPGTSTTADDPAPTTTAAVEEVVSPAVAAVVTPRAAGSAVLVEPGILVTNAHVVWPHDRVEVRFPGGPAGPVSVLRIDWVADLAILDTSTLEGLPAPLPTAPSVPAPGSLAVLVGRSGADGTGLRIERGTVTGVREWDAGGLSFVVTDLPIGDGQSGGALVDGAGALLGITGLSERDLAVALSAPDLARRIGSTDDGAIDRRLDDLLGADGGSVGIRHLLDEAVFVLDPAGTVRLTLPGEGFETSVVGPDGFEEARVVDAGGLSLEPARTVRFVVLSPLVPPDGPVTIAAEPGMIRPLLDPDHGRRLAVGGTLLANSDYPGDLDWFEVELEEGDRVEIVAGSTNMDPALVVAPLDGLGTATVATDSDSGGGPLGWDARLLYVASRTGPHVVAVYDEGRFGPGAYVLGVERSG